MIKLLDNDSKTIINIIHKLKKIEESMSSKTPRDETTQSKMKNILDGIKYRFNIAEVNLKIQQQALSKMKTNGKKKDWGEKRA